MDRLNTFYYQGVQNNNILSGYYYRGNKKSFTDEKFILLQHCMMGLTKVQ